YYCATSAHKAELSGLENQVLYESNLKRLTRLLAGKQSSAGLIANMRRNLDTVKDRYYNRRQKQIARLIAANGTGSISAEKYYRLLEKLARAGAIEMTRYPNISAFLLLQGMHREINPRRINRELRQLLAALKKTMPFRAYAALTALANRPDEQDNFYDAVYSAAMSGNIALERDMASLNGFMQYRQISARLHLTRLIAEENALIRDIMRANADTRSARDVAFMVYFMEILANVVDTQVTAEDYRYYTTNRTEFQSLWNQYAYDGSMARLDGVIKELDAYNTTNLARNAVFMDTIREAVNGAGGRRTSVMVCGGFHTAGMQALLDRARISYAVITPRTGGDAVTSGATYARVAREQGDILAQTLALYNLSQCLVSENNGLKTSGDKEVLISAAEIKLQQLIADKSSMTKDSFTAAMNSVAEEWNRDMGARLGPIEYRGSVAERDGLAGIFIVNGLALRFVWRDGKMTFAGQEERPLAIGAAAVKARWGLAAYRRYIEQIAPRIESILFPLTGMVIMPVAAYYMGLGLVAGMGAGVLWATVGFAFAHVIVDWIHRGLDSTSRDGRSTLDDDYRNFNEKLLASIGLGLPYVIPGLLSVIVTLAVTMPLIAIPVLTAAFISVVVINESVTRTHGMYNAGRIRNATPIELMKSVFAHAGGLVRLFAKSWGTALIQPIPRVRTVADNDTGKRSRLTHVLRKQNELNVSSRYVGAWKVALVSGNPVCERSENDDQWGAVVEQQKEDQLQETVASVLAGYPATKPFTIVVSEGYGVLGSMDMQAGVMYVDALALQEGNAILLAAAVDHELYHWNNPEATEETTVRRTQNFIAALESTQRSALRGVIEAEYGRSIAQALGNGGDAAALANQMAVTAADRAGIENRVQYFSNRDGKHWIVIDGEVEYALEKKTPKDPAQYNGILKWTPSGLDTIRELLRARALGEHVLLVGDAGTGKD
ncbi:MAG: hypothetical protein WCG51_05535, partial [Elusimicrobiota bacterium]